MSMKLSSSGSRMCLRATSPVLEGRYDASVRHASGCLANSAHGPPCADPHAQRGTHTPKQLKGASRQVPGAQMKPCSCKRDEALRQEACCVQVTMRHQRKHRACYRMLQA